MKKQKNNKKSKKLLRKTKNRLIKNKSSKKAKAKKHYKKKSLHKNKRKKHNTKKRTQMVMKGGALPFSELYPSNLFEQLSHSFTSKYFSDNAQPVPDNLPHKVSPSVVEQPYLDGKLNEEAVVIGASPDIHFATPNS